MKDVVIIGAGPAGLTAAVYVQRAGKTALVLDKKGYGGQITNAGEVENYPGFASIRGVELAEAMYRQALGQGAEVKTEEATGIEKTEGGYKVKTAESEYDCKAVIIATGAKNRTLDIDGETRLTGSGVSYCATCDGNFFRGRDVAVIGGGNTAIDDAEILSDLANKVYLVHRRDEFRGDEATVERLKAKDNVEMVLSSVPVRIEGDFAVSSLVVAPKEGGEERKLDVQGVFVAVGQVPDNKAFEAFVELDQAGYVAGGEDCLTKSEGIFVAGDCRTKKVRQLATATSDGAAAATAAMEYINAAG